jgi:hypothetical protein
MENLKTAFGDMQEDRPADHDDPDSSARTLWANVTEDRHQAKITLTMKQIAEGFLALARRWSAAALQFYGYGPAGWLTAGVIVPRWRLLDL